MSKILEALNGELGNGFVGNNMARKRLLQKFNDTYMGQDWNDFVQLVESRGFELVHKETFGSREDTQCIWVDASKGLFLVAESYFDSVNRTTIYGQFESDQRPQLDLQINCEHGVCFFESDAREALFTKISSIENEGFSFLKEWKAKEEYLRIEHSFERENGYDRKHIFEQKLPIEIRQMICCN